MNSDMMCGYLTARLEAIRIILSTNDDDWLPKTSIKMLRAMAGLDTEKGPPAEETVDKPEPFAL